MPMTFSKSMSRSFDERLSGTPGRHCDAQARYSNPDHLFCGGYCSCTPRNNLGTYSLYVPTGKLRRREEACKHISGCHCWQALWFHPLCAKIA
ncbi:unnamed protein product [Periconia digitata]|uniref:Uncharacterized protein n=1 Tax=Periconia digitata TaxID=1303443 RepID=A0A9W4UME8_9PLEO|nr:unnamed protein product [Periconia digitata]